MIACVMRSAYDILPHALRRVVDFFDVKPLSEVSEAALDGTTCVEPTVDAGGDGILNDRRFTVTQYKSYTSDTAGFLPKKIPR